jgi:tRNA-splicing ligase RtcB (3'-phosphate/5'-hydroxy nucleic acid ligase)
MNNEIGLPPIRLWLAGPIPANVADALAHLRQTPDVARVAVMPDVHLAGRICIGTVVATSHLVFPDAVGSDIGCGMAAIGFDAPAQRLADARIAERVFDALNRGVPILRHENSDAGDLPKVLRALPLSDPKLEKEAMRDGRLQLGTLGRGNHFLEFQRDDDGMLWLMVHSGSRAMGQSIAAHHLSLAKKVVNGFCCFAADEPKGKAYLNDVQWALTYADQNRRLIVEAVIGLVRDLLGVDSFKSTFRTCHHNHVQAEVHFGQDLWVHRKGAIPAGEGVVGIIPGSMGSSSFHVEGRGEPEALCSSSHGAGRAMDRAQARRTVSEKDLHRQLKGIWYDPRKARSLRDEAPSAYKDIQEVMRAQKDLTRIVRRLRPILCFKGS